jgi:hypothetical protein
MGVEQAMDELAQFQRALELASCRRLGGLQALVGHRPGGEILGLVQRLGGRGLPPPIARIGELQAQVGAIHN